MVSIRSFGFVLVFVLVLIGESTAHSQGTKGKLAADETGLEPARENLAKLVKEVYDAVPTAADAGNSKFGGRKMMLKWGLDRKAATEEGSDGEETAKISGADQSVAKSSHTGKRGILNVNRKLRDRNPHGHREKAKTGGFTAFSADYHVPRPHPPKNN